jgi:predicted MFS family arabinose efflux permease
MGMQQVLFSWIVVGELKASGEWVGIAQTSTLVPGLVLWMVGGVLADRWDPRRLLVGLHLLSVIPVALLAVFSDRGWLDMPLLIAFGLSVGTIGALAMPARDTMLSRVAGGDLMRAVTGMTASQFGCQAVGSLVAGLARFTGSPAMLLVQAGVFLVGAGAALRLPRARPESLIRGRLRLGEIAGGVTEVARTPALRGPFVLVVAVGVLFVGPYWVVFPLLVRDYYQLGIASLSVLLMLFPLGTILGSLVLRHRGLRRKGRAALLALVAACSAQLTIASGVSFPVMLALALAWGLAGSVFINCSRTLFQQAAPIQGRGRVLAIYQLGFAGGGPIGALLAGFGADALGLHATLVVSATTMLILVAGMAIFSDVSRLR